MPKILIVDDDSHIVDVYRLILEKEGFEVISASNRQQGMTEVEESSPDLMILDVMMDYPDDGISMSRELRSKGFDLPILMLTGLKKVSGMDYDKDDELVPVDEFLEKPIDSTTLVSAVKKLLGE